jgi:hypothetical protein
LAAAGEREREEGVEVWAPGGASVVDNTAVSTMALARTIASVDSAAH